MYTSALVTATQINFVITQQPALAQQGTILFSTTMFISTPLALALSHSVQHLIWRHPQSFAREIAHDGRHNIKYGKIVAMIKRHTDDNCMRSH